MKKHLITTYSFEELSKDAQKRAIEDHKDFLNETMGDDLNEVMQAHLELLLDNADVKGEGKALYSLNYSQGDGAMFEGDFTWRGWEVSIKHSGRDYHSNSREIEIIKENGDYSTDEGFADDKIYAKFEKVYQKICKALEKYGYDYIEYKLEDEHVAEEIKLNEYEFNKNGSLFAY